MRKLTLATVATAVLVAAVPALRSTIRMCQRASAQRITPGQWATPRPAEQTRLVKHGAGGAQQRDPPCA